MGSSSAKGEAASRSESKKDEEAICLCLKTPTRLSYSVVVSEGLLAGLFPPPLLPAVLTVVR